MRTHAFRIRDDQLDFAAPIAQSWCSDFCCPIGKLPCWLIAGLHVVNSAEAQPVSSVVRNLSDPAAAPASIVLKRAAALLGDVKVPRSEREFALLAGRPVAPTVIGRLLNFGVQSRHLAFIMPPRTLWHE